MGRAEQKADVLVKDQSPGDVKNEVSSRPEDAHSFRLLSAEDKHGFMLLVLLYMLQGIPVGLAFGTMPFLLKSYVGYSQLGIFMLSTYPYSLKLLWSPIVDSLFVSAWRIP